MKRIQSLPNTVASSEYLFTDEGIERSIWVSIFSPNYQEDGLASHWMSRVLLQTPQGEVVGSISGIGVDSLQALSLALKMSGYKLMDYTNSSESFCFCDYPESKKSVLKLISTDSSSLVEMEESTDASIDSPVVAQLAGLSVHGPQAQPTNLSISIKFPTETEDMWYCTIEFLGLNQCKTYASRDSTRVLAKAFRGLHRQMLEWQHKGFKILDEEGQNLLEEQSLNCYFHSDQDVSSSLKNAQERVRPFRYVVAKQKSI